MKVRHLKNFSHETIIGMLIDVIRDAADPEPVRDVVTRNELVGQAQMVVSEIYQRLAEADRQQLLATLAKDKEQ